MLDGVIPVDAVSQAFDVARGDVQLQREEAARRPRRAKQEPPAVTAFGDADHAR